MIFIPAALIDEIKAEGEGAYPNECCGIIYGTCGDDGKEAKSIDPIHNSSEIDEQYHRFLITPEEMMKAELQARSQRLDILGFYHSHPDHPAKPSEYDREHALPFYSYVIVSVDGGKAKDVTSWELADDRSFFDREELIIRRTRQ